VEIVHVRDKQKNIGGKQEMNKEPIVGYKVFKPDWTCRGFQYEVGKTYEEGVTPYCCNRRFHFCKDLKDCFDYYRFDPDNKVAKVVALGEIDEDSMEYCTNKIQIVEEISWEDVLRMINSGKGNTGRSNSGNGNSGDSNGGNYNTGDFNAGACNSGCNNSGDYNSGNYNTGSCNTGDHNDGEMNTGHDNTGNGNTGDFNSGNHNTGDFNSGDRNTGDWNSGNCNRGSRNSGSYNCGNYNSGNHNSGYLNSGNFNGGNHNTGNHNNGSFNTGDFNIGARNFGNSNVGNWNTGDFNVGDWNKTNFSNGSFNTEEPKIFLFNKPSDWTYQDWLDSDARHLLNQIPKRVTCWVSSNDMSDEEKGQHTEYKTTNGYVKILDESGNGQTWWNLLPEEHKNIIKAIPNFDAGIFKEITGIDINS
jgi:hypothetical protein